MSSFGRIRRSSAKVAKAPQGAAGRRYVGVGVEIERDRGSYRAEACVLTSGQMPSEGCAYGVGRTPQSATAKALKRLGARVARRNKSFYR